MNLIVSFRSEIRRLKLCLPPLINEVKRTRCRCPCHRPTLRGLDDLGASQVTQKPTGYAVSSTSVALSCSQSHTVSHKVSETLLWLFYVMLWYCQRYLTSCSVWLCRADKAEDAAGSPRFNWHPHLCCWPQARGGSKGELLLYHIKCTFISLCESLHPQEDLKFWLYSTELASAAYGPAEARGGPPVRWTSLLSQHRRGEAAAGINSCRRDTRQTGTTTDMYSILSCIILWN